MEIHKKGKEIYNEIVCNNLSNTAALKKSKLPNCTGDTKNVIINNAKRRHMLKIQNINFLLLLLDIEIISIMVAS